MKVKDIVIGGVYCNRGAGRTARKVLDIGSHLKPSIFSTVDSRGKVAVLFEQNGKQGCLLMTSFAQWCGRRVIAP